MRRRMSNDPMVRIGQGFGEAVIDARAKKRQERVHRHFAKLMPELVNVEFTVVYVIYDEENYDSRLSKRKQTFAQLVDDFIEAYRRTDWDVLKDLKSYKTFGDITLAIGESMSDGCCSLVGVFTPDEYKQYKQDQDRKKCERVAAEFAQACGKPLGTFEFIAALEEAIEGLRRDREHWNNPEVQMEEFAAHRFAARGAESYIEDRNYMSSQFHQRQEGIADVWDYLQTHCPLLMAQYEEQKIAAAK